MVSVFRSWTEDSHHHVLRGGSIFYEPPTWTVLTGLASPDPEDHIHCYSLGWAFAEEPPCMMIVTVAEVALRPKTNGLLLKSKTRSVIHVLCMRSGGPDPGPTADNALRFKKESPLQIIPAHQKSTLFAAHGLSPRSCSTFFFKLMKL